MPAKWASIIDGHASRFNAYGTTARNCPNSDPIQPNITSKARFSVLVDIQKEYGRALIFCFGTQHQNLSIRSQGDLSSLFPLEEVIHTRSPMKKQRHYGKCQNYFPTCSLSRFWSSKEMTLKLLPKCWMWKLQPPKRKQEKKWSTERMARTESGGMKLWQPVTEQTGRFWWILKNDYSYVSSKLENGPESDWTVFTVFPILKNAGIKSLTIAWWIERRNELIHLKELP